MPSGGFRPNAGRPRKDEGAEAKGFTAEQLEELLASPHISFVSQKTVSYTGAFKELFWRRYCDGAEPMQIFKDAGLDTDALGRTRVNGFLRMLKKQKEKGLPFNEGSEPHTNQPEKQYDFPKPPRKPKDKRLVLNDADIAKMFHQVVYLTQEIEFIKKIILAGKDGK